MTRSTFPNRLAALVFGLAALAVAVVAVAVAAPAEGQETDGGTVTWGISPATADGRDTRATVAHVVEPGEEVVDHVVVDNHGDRPLTLDLYAGDARPAGGEFDVAAADEPSEAIGAWVALDVGRIEVPAGEHVIVPFTIRVPVNAEPGDHAGGILASRTSTSGAGDDVGVEAERRVGTRVHLRVAGPITPGLTIDSLEVDHAHRALSFAPGRVEVRFRVRNTGNIRLTADTAVQVEGPLGLGGRSGPGDEIVDLLPGHSVQRSVLVDGVWPTGRLKVDVVTRPTASADQPLDGTVPVARARQQVWALPYALLIGLVLLGAALVARRRRRAARAVGDGPDVADAT